MGSSTIIWLCVSLSAILIGVVAYNYIHSRWLYHPTREHVAFLLASSLNGLFLEKEIDYFISAPVRHDPLLEAIRNLLGKLYGPSSFTSTGSWTPAAEIEIQAMLQSLAQPNPSFKRDART